MIRSIGFTSLEIREAVSQLKHLPGRHDQATHGNRFGRVGKNPRALVHIGGGPPGRNVHHYDENDEAAVLGPEPPSNKPKTLAEQREPDDTWKSAYETQRDLVWSKHAAVHGMTLDQYKQAVDAHTQKLVDGADMWMRASESVLGKVLAGGKFKNAFEVPPSPFAKYSLSQRETAEKNLFGLAKGTKAEDRPIYGYLSEHKDGGDNWRLDGYGDVAIKLKKRNLEDRVTLTAEDSMGSTGAGTTPLLVPKPMKHADGSMYNISDSPNPAYPHRRAVDPLQLKSIDQGMDQSTYRYVETQTHGGVQTSDIEEVVFQYPPSSATQTALNKQNISWRVR